MQFQVGKGFWSFAFRWLVRKKNYGWRHKAVLNWRNLQPVFYVKYTVVKTVGIPYIYTCIPYSVYIYKHECWSLLRWWSRTMLNVLMLTISFKISIQIHFQNFQSNSFSKFSNQIHVQNFNSNSKLKQTTVCCLHEISCSMLTLTCRVVLCRLLLFHAVFSRV